MKHSIKNIWAKLAMTYTILVCTFTVCIIAVFAIPTNSLRNNIKQSAEQIEKEGLWFQPMGFYLFQIDNMTDCLMMNINVCADSDNPVEAAMNTERGYTRARQRYTNKPICKVLAWLSGCSQTFIMFLQLQSNTSIKLHRDARTSLCYRLSAL